MGANACSDGWIGGVDRDGIGSASRVLAIGDHLWQFEQLGASGWYGRADVAGGVPDQKGHLLGGDVLGGDDEVAFIFPAGVVHHNYEFAIACPECAHQSLTRETQRQYREEEETYEKRLLCPVCYRTWCGRL